MDMPGKFGAIFGAILYFSISPLVKLLFLKINQKSPFLRDGYEINRSSASCGQDGMF